MKSRRAAKRRSRISRSERVRLLIMAGALPAVAVLWAAVVGTGGFEPAADFGWMTLLLGVAVLGSGLGMAIRQWQGQAEAGSLQEAAGPLLWTVAVWMLYRLLAAGAPQIILLPAGYLGWLVISYPLAMVWLPLSVALGMETILTLTGGQTPLALGINLVTFGSGATALALFASSRVYRHQLRQAFRRTREEATTREYARDLGLLAAAPTVEGLQILGDRPSTVETISISFKLQLEMLREALGLTTVAVLWPDADGRELRLRSFASARSDLLPGPYPLGQGITGALYRTGNEVAVAPVPIDYSGLPYYRGTDGVGSLYALKIADEAVAGGGPASASFGILCVDRVATTAWDEGACRVLQLAALKIAKEVAMGRRLEDTDRERHTIRQIYHGLIELNAVLGLESAFAASVKAIRAQVRADFMAISLLEGDQHRVAYAEGPEAEKVIGLVFPQDDGLVGQVLKLNRALPSGGTYRGAAPVFSRNQRLAEFGSLLILPLRKEKGEPIGALVVAAREGGIFTETGLQILELIATQVAVKIDLAQAHERINSMATTDGLTGLANHRTFQHGFDRMLSRAEREASSLCLLLCDLDYFKQVNDTYGHPFGDQVLKAVADILAGAVRQIDMAARYGGEEFTVILEKTDRRQGLQVADRIRKQVQDLTLWHGNERITPTMSIGLAVYPEDGEKKPQLIGRADRALYHAKETGRNRVSTWAQLPPTARDQRPGD
jgi:two-component system, cell cycle response regulator